MSNSRDIKHNQFGPHTVINQGDAHIHLTHPPARTLIRVIPYPPNEDIVRRSDIVDRLDRLLPPISEHQSAALWGLGGSG